jgi:hypothetical protein
VIFGRDILWVNFSELRFDEVRVLGILGSSPAL